MYKAEATINVPASQQKVWEYVSNYQNFDQFMSHVEKVTQIDSRTSEWRLRGPLGIPVTWQAVTSSMEAPRHLGWQSIEGGLQTHGYIQVAESGQGSRVTVHVEYTPPGGAIGKAFATLFKNPQRMLEDDMERLGEIISGWPTEAQQTGTGAQRGSSR